MDNRLSLIEKDVEALSRLLGSYRIILSNPKYLDDPQELRDSFMASAIELIDVDKYVNETLINCVIHILDTDLIKDMNTKIDLIIEMLSEVIKNEEAYIRDRRS